MALSVEPVSGRNGMTDFIRAPREVYAEDPCWVQPLTFERREAFSAKHPFFRHARWQPFVAYRDGRPVGRISAQIDELYQQQHDPRGVFLAALKPSRTRP